MIIFELLNDKGCKPEKKTAKEYSSPCPWCGGDERFVINPDKYDVNGRYVWRKWYWTADSIKLVRELTGASYKKACEILGRNQDWKPGQSNSFSKPAWVPTEHQSPDGLWQKKAEEFVDKCSTELLNHSGALKWLASRGINTVTAKKYKLCWNVGRDGKDSFRMRKAWGLKEITKANGKPKMLWLSVGLVIPCSVEGKVCRMRIQRTTEAIKSGASNYYCIPGLKNNAFVLEPEREGICCCRDRVECHDCGPTCQWNSGGGGLPPNLITMSPNN